MRVLLMFVVIYFSLLQTFGQISTSNIPLKKNFLFKPNTSNLSFYFEDYFFKKIISSTPPAKFTISYQKNAISNGIFISAFKIRENYGYTSNSISQTGNVFSDNKGAHISIGYDLRLIHQTRDGKNNLMVNPFIGYTIYVGDLTKGFTDELPSFVFGLTLYVSRKFTNKVYVNSGLGATTYGWGSFGFNLRTKELDGSKKRLRIIKGDEIEIKNNWWKHQNKK